MDNFKSFQQIVYQMDSSHFESIAIELFKYQVKNNPLYANYVNFLGKNVATIHSIQDIPFLPIEFFKHHIIKSGEWTTEEYFESSGTTGMHVSTHHIRDLEFYLEQSKKIFTKEYGPLEDYRILALLPSYLEREHSSLIAMVQSFIKQAASGSGFYLDNYKDLLNNLRKRDKKIIIWGVTFAILELAERYPSDLNDVIIMETGGMKGRRKEMTREEFYRYLNQRLNVETVHAEYGMTELLSQAYGVNGKFRLADSMQVLIRDINDPFDYVESGKTGGINIVDLANIHSCAFIETKDLGKVNIDGSFEVLGRFDNSDLRGCNLLVI